MAVLKALPSTSVNCIVTSPPYYGLRDYGVDGQIGLEESVAGYVERLVAVFHEARRVLKDDGTLWLNLGDSYSGSGKGRNADGSRNFDESKQSTNVGTIIGKVIKSGGRPKNLLGIPWRVAFALQDDGWNLRQDIIWNKPNPMPESVTDRCTKAHEYIFLLSKSSKYYFDHEAIKEPATTTPAARDKHAEGYQADYVNGDRFSAGERVYGADGKRNKRSVWTITPKPYKGTHFATFPENLVVPCILAGSPVGGVVMDVFGGAGTTGVVARNLGRESVLIELNPEYVKLIHNRLEQSN